MDSGPLDLPELRSVTHYHSQQDEIVPENVYFSEPNNFPVFFFPCIQCQMNSAERCEILSPDKRMIEE